MKQGCKERTEEKPPEDKCHHYWIIAVADGPRSRGRCKYCGATKEFLNSYPDFNPLKRSNNPLSLPGLPDVKVDKDSKS